MTLKITIRPQDEERTRVRLEGRFRAADLDVLDGCLEAREADALELDLTGLHWLDPAAALRLSALVRAGARIVAASPFVERLLARGGAEIAGDSGSSDRTNNESRD